VLIQAESEISNSYQAWGTPSALIVSPERTIASPLASGAEQIKKLVETWTSGLPMTFVSGDGADPSRVVAAAGITVGEPAPSLTLPDLSGSSLDVAVARDHGTVLLFWSPDCGFCQQMLPDLRRWEASRPGTAPDLLLISRGTAAANEAMGVRSPVVLDQEFKTGRLYGASGTPTAVLVDSKARVASPLAVGAEEVLALCQRAESVIAE
jgi:hypothetical protein